MENYYKHLAVNKTRNLYIMRSKSPILLSVSDLIHQWRQNLIAFTVTHSLYQEDQRSATLSANNARHIIISPVYVHACMCKLLRELYLLLLVKASIYLSVSTHQIHQERKTTMHFRTNYRNVKHSMMLTSKYGGFHFSKRYCSCCLRRISYMSCKNRFTTPWHKY